MSAEITRMDKVTAKKLGDELAKAAQAIAAKYGIKAIGKGGTFSDTNFVKKIEFSVMKTAEGKTPEQAEFEKYAKLFDLEATDFGKEITLSGEKFTISGLKTKASKNQVQITRADGATFVTSVAIVNKKLGRSVASIGNKCKYCGKDNGSTNPDMLCKGCKETFGHTYFSEL